MMGLSGEGNRIRAAPLRSSLDCWNALSCLPTLLISSSDAAQYFNGYVSKEMKVAARISECFFRSMQSRT